MNVTTGQSMEKSNARATDNTRHPSTDTQSDEWTNR